MHDSAAEARDGAQGTGSSSSEAVRRERILLWHGEERKEGERRGGIGMQVLLLSIFCGRDRGA